MEMRTKFKVMLKATAVTVGVVLSCILMYVLFTLGVYYMLTDIGRLVLACFMVVGIIVYIFMRAYGDFYEEVLREEEEEDCE